MSDMSPILAVAGRKLGDQKILASRWFKCGLLKNGLNHVSRVSLQGRVDYFSCASYAWFCRVADEHRSFVSCLNIVTGSGPCRVQPRHSCNPLTLLQQFNPLKAVGLNSQMRHQTLAVVSIPESEKLNYMWGSNQLVNRFFRKHGQVVGRPQIGCWTQKRATRGMLGAKRRGS